MRAVDACGQRLYSSRDSTVSRMQIPETTSSQPQLDHSHNRERASIVIELLHDDAEPPRRATSGSAGYDLFAYVSGRTIDCSDGHRQWHVEAERTVAGDRVALPAGAMALIPLGFKARLPNGYEAQIRPRSGAAFKKGLGIPNAPGTVDSDFPDEWRVIVRNTTEHELTISHGERIAQMVLQRYEVLPFVDGQVAVSTERQGGFGSTGH
jgi:dUTP pyrophosphatase